MNKTAQNRINELKKALALSTKNQRLLEKELNNLKQELEDSKELAWPLPEDTEHYYINFYGDVEFCEDTFGDALTEALSAERCNTLRDKQLLMRDMELFVEKYAPEWKPDWHNVDQNKWGIELLNSELCTEVSGSYNLFVLQVSVPTEELANRMLELFGDRIKELYL